MKRFVRSTLVVLVGSALGIASGDDGGGGNGSGVDILPMGGAGEGLYIVMGPEFYDPSTDAVSRWVTVTGKLGWPFSSHYPVIPEPVKVDGDELSFTITLRLAGFDEEFSGSEYRLHIYAWPEHYGDDDPNDDPVGWVDGYSSWNGRGRAPVNM